MPRVWEWRVFVGSGLLLLFQGWLAPIALSRPETQDLAGQVVDQEHNSALAGAVCTLTGKTLPVDGLSVTTDERGDFRFPGLAVGTYSLTCAALGHEPLFKGGLEVTDTAPPFIEVALPAEIVVKQHIEVKEQAPSIAEQSAGRPAGLRSAQLAALPLIEQKFKAALPLIPGVIRTPSGRINIKGMVENQGLLLVDSAEMVDPVTGAFAIEIPIDAIESLHVFKSAYRTDYGRFSGGLTTIETKAPSGKFHWELNDFLPTLRIKGGHIMGIQDDEPRLYVTAPLWTNRLNFSEALEYNFSREPVRGLPFPHNEIKTQGFNSFTSLQYVLSSQQLMTADIDFFPKREQFANINSLVPQSASSDYGQKGFTTHWTDRYLFSSGSILTTLVQFMKFDSNAHGQGPEDMLVTPNGWGGNFFNAYNRQSNQEQLQQTFDFARRHWLGTHNLQVGAQVVRGSYTATNESHPVRVLRSDGTLAEQITLSAPASLAATDTEVAAFAQDRWAFTDRLALTGGLRFSTQTIGEPAAFAPRLGVVYSPGTSSKTVLRGGVGVFYDRVPLIAGDFTENPTRSEQFFNEQGMPLGPPIVLQNAYIRFSEGGRTIVPSNHRLDSTPYNITWSAEVGRELTPTVLVRLSYLSSRTYNEFTINPLIVPNTPPTLLLSNTGNSRYHEFESTVRFRPFENADVNVSYVHSLARGDLNTLAYVYVPFEQPVIRPDFFGDLPSNVPNRLVTWSTFKLPWKVAVSPVFDLHTGFPYSAVDVLQNYVGEPNSLRFPTFASLDLKLSKDFRISWLPWFKHHTLRGAVTVFNVTNHFNPNDVFNNVTSPFFGHFVGFQHRFYDAYVDIVY